MSYGHLFSTGTAKHPIMLRTVPHNRQLSGPHCRWYQDGEMLLSRKMKKKEKRERFRNKETSR